MQKPLTDSFQDLTEEQRSRVLDLIDTLSEDVQSVVFPPVTYMSVMSPVNSPVATHWVDMEAFKVIKNAHILNIQFQNYYEFFALHEIILLLKGKKPKEYIATLNKNLPLSQKAKNTAKFILIQASTATILIELAKLLKVLSQ